MLEKRQGVDCKGPVDLNGRRSESQLQISDISDSVTVTDSDSVSDASFASAHCKSTMYVLLDGVNTPAHRLYRPPKGSGKRKSAPGTPGDASVPQTPVRMHITLAIALKMFNISPRL